MRQEMYLLKIDITDLWAKLGDDEKDPSTYQKPSQDILTHCFLTGYVAEFIIKHLVNPFVFPKCQIPLSIVPHIVLHDLGKISLSFLCKSEKWIEDISIRYNVDGLTNEEIKNFFMEIHRRLSFSQDPNIRKKVHHSVIGSYLFRKEILKNTNFFKELPNSYSIEFLSDIEALHHGYKKATDIPVNRSLLECQEIPVELDSSMRLKFCQLVEEEFGPLNDIINFTPSLNDSIVRTIHGIVILSDWIASSITDIRIDNLTDLTNHKESLKRIVENKIQHIGLVPSSTNRKQGLSFSDVFTSLDEKREPFNMNLLQRIVNSIPLSEADRGSLIMIEDFMGAGKTEADLWIAYKIISLGLANGFYFAFPTQVTSNGAYQRINRFINNILINSNYDKDDAPILKLMHGNSFLTKENQEFRDLFINNFFGNNKKGILYPYVIGTVDQILHSILNGKHANLKFFGICNKVVIIDEMHSYSAYTSPIIKKTIKKLLDLGCFVIVSTGTLSYGQKKSMLEEIVTDTKELKKCLSSMAKHRNEYPLITKITI